MTSFEKNFRKPIDPEHTVIASGIEEYSDFPEDFRSRTREESLSELQWNKILESTSILAMFSENNEDLHRQARLEKESILFLEKNQHLIPSTLKDKDRGESLARSIISIILKTDEDFASLEKGVDMDPKKIAAKILTNNPDVFSQILHKEISSDEDSWENRMIFTAFETALKIQTDEGAIKNTKAEKNIGSFFLQNAEVIIATWKNTLVRQETTDSESVSIKKIQAEGMLPFLFKLSDEAKKANEDTSKERDILSLLVDDKGLSIFSDDATDLAYIRDFFYKFLLTERHSQEPFFEIGKYMENNRFFQAFCEIYGIPKEKFIADWKENYTTTLLSKEVISKLREKRNTFIENSAKQLVYLGLKYGKKDLQYLCCSNAYEGNTTFQDKDTDQPRENTVYCGIRNLARYPVGFLENLIQQRDILDQPYGLIIYPKNDHNGAFHYPSNIEQLRYSVRAIDSKLIIRLIEVDSIGDLTRKLIRFKSFYANNDSEKRISFAIVGGHGTKSSIDFNHKQSHGVLLQSIFSGKGASRLGRNFLSEDAPTLFISCSTGVPGGIADEFSSTLTPQNVIVAPQGNGGANNLWLRRNSEGKLYFDVHFVDEKAKSISASQYSGKHNTSS